MKHTTARVLALGLVLWACQTPIQAHHEYDRTARFGEYASFAWVTNEPLIRPFAGVSAGQDARISPIAEQTIRRAVERNLLAKGYQKLDDPREADLVLSFSLGARDKIEVNSYPAHAGYGYGRWGSYGGAYYSDVRSYTEGILAIDVFDTRARQAVWHGWATKRVSPSADQQTRTATLNQGVDAILEPFPFRNTQK